RIYSLEAQVVQRPAKSIFQGAPLRCALGLGQSGVESCHAYPALSDTTPRRTRGGVARTGLLSAVPLCGTGAIMVRVYRQPDERLSTQRPERLTRTFNYTLEHQNTRTPSKRTLEGRRVRGFVQGRCPEQERRLRAKSAGG